MYEAFKNYMKKHGDTFVTICIVVLIDHVFLGGALRDRLRRLLEGLLDRSERLLSEPKGKSGEASGS